MRGSALVAVAWLAVACSGGNTGSNGSYSFTGDGWTLGSTTDGDHWTKGTDKLIVITQATQHASAMEWAASDYGSLTGPPVPAPSLFAPTAFPGTSAVWFGWVFTQQSENVYEYYLVGSSKELQAEISGPTLTQADAQAVLSTLQLH